MKNIKLNIVFAIVAVSLSLSFRSEAQISAPGRNWSDTTQYSKAGVVQDSIFVFFSSSTTPKKGSLSAKFSDGSPSNFTWYKYDETKPLASRFQLYSSENGVLVSSINNLSKGGYKVVATRVSDGTSETYYCWLMIDEVEITGMNIYNGCDFLEVKVITNPTALSILNDNIFSYWDIKSYTTYHGEMDKYSNDYFKNVVWQASNPEVPVTSDATLTLTIHDPAPLYDSKYKVVINNPFGRTFQSETALLEAKATKADFTIYLDNNGAWSDRTSSPSGEAPLKMKLESKSINADSIYWRVINDEKLFKSGGDSIVWRDSALFSERTDAYPPAAKMIPGTFPIEHIAQKISSGCRDTMKITVEVDTSALGTDAIPNVFTPNGDGTNDKFKLDFKEEDPKKKISSIKSFKIMILSRQGQLIYDYSGDPKEWDGWDGKVKGSNHDAPEGIYYYIVEAAGWDKKKFKGGKYKGFLYLFRGR